MRAIPRLIELERRITPALLFPDIVNRPHPDIDPFTTSPPNIPSGFHQFAPPVSAITANSSAPVIAEWTRTGNVDQTLAITGDGFTTNTGIEAGKDSEFYFYGQTGTTQTKALAGSTLRLDGPRAAVTIPSVPDHTVYLMWAANSAGASQPVAVNRAETTWSSGMASPGEDVSVYGQNFDLGDGLTRVFVQPPNWTTTNGVWIVPASSNPYRVTFKVPIGWTNGDYQVFIHNGHGGKYGWSNPQTVAIRDPLPSGPTSGGIADGFFDVTKTMPMSATPNDPSDDDADPIYSAIIQASAYIKAHPGNGATVYFPAGTYDLGQMLDLSAYYGPSIGVPGKNDIRFEGAMIDGKRASTIQPKAEMQYLVFGDNYGLENIQFKNLNLRANGHLGTLGTVLHMRRNTDLVFDNVLIEANGLATSPLDASLGNRITLINCEIVASYFMTFYFGTRQVSIENCNFLGVRDVETFIQLWGTEFFSITNCTATDYNPNDSNGLAGGRFFVTQDHFGANHNIYIGNNETINLGPRDGLDPQIPVDAKRLNVGEQLSFEGLAPLFEGRPPLLRNPNFDAKTINLPGLEADYTSYDPTPTTAIIVEGKGVGQRRHVVSIDLQTDTVIVDEPWTIVPDITSTISISSCLENVVIYQNKLDGRDNGSQENYKGSASRGISLYVGSASHLVADGNIITNVNNGISDWEFQSNALVPNYDPRPRVDTSLFATYINNTVTHAHSGVDIVSNVADGGYAPAGYGAVHLGTLIRGNTFEDIRDAVVNGQAPFIGTGIRIDGPNTYRLVDLTIVEGNSNVGNVLTTGIDLDIYNTNRVNNAILRKNSFTGSGATASKAVHFPANTGQPGVGTSTSGLFNNTWAGFATKYNGTKLPGAILELPQRVVRLGAENPLTAYIPICNGGTAMLTYQVYSDSSWLIVEADAFPSPESGGNFWCETNPAGLGNGVYTATITVIGNNQTQTITVELTVTGTPDVGPSHGLPSFRPDRVTTFEAEYFDLGGVGKGFGPNANDHVVTLSTGQTIIQQASFGDYYNYTINVPAGGLFRVEGRLRGYGGGGAVTIQYGSESVTMHTETGGPWETVRPVNIGNAETFMNLAYGLQTLKVSIASGVGPDIDWIRFSPVDSAKVGLTLPYAVTAPVISQFGSTTIQTELYDKGGKGVAYSDLWTANNSLSGFRTEDNVAIDGTGPSNYAVRGVKNRWQGYTVNVANAGKYRVTFRLSSQGEGYISIRNGSNAILGSTAVGATGSYNNYNEDQFTFVTLNAGVQSLHLWNDPKNSVQIDWMKFAPVDLSLAGNVTPPTTVANSPVQQLGTQFGVNVTGYIDALRFYVNEYEFNIGQPHTLKLWRISPYEGPQIPNSPPFVAQLIASVGLLASNSVQGWNNVPLATPALLQPGLYMVSVTVNVSYSYSSLAYLGLPQPSLLTLVAGYYGSAGNDAPMSIANNPAEGRFFGVDVLFRPDF